MAASAPFGAYRRLDGVTAIYGGSFDPPHMGHQMACLFLLEALGAEAVWLVPTHAHAFGKQLAPFAHRFAMCQELARPFAQRVEVSRVEEELGGQSRTHATLTHLRRLAPSRPFALAVGADLVDQMPRWHRFEDLVREVPVVVIGRAGYPMAHIPVELPGISSLEVRGRIEAGAPTRGWMPASVGAYVEAHALYRPATPRAPRPGPSDGEVGRP